MNAFTHTTHLKTLMMAALAALMLFSGCSDDDDDDDDQPQTQEELIVGTWLSAGSNVAPLLANNQLFPGGGVDTLVATFGNDNTYEVTQVNRDGSRFTLEGTYAVAEGNSTVNPNVFTITLNQTVPAAVTSEGIFEVDASADPDQMRYEVAQTAPQVQGVTAPTADGGFGSTSGGAFQTTNVQVYVRQ